MSIIVMGMALWAGLFSLPAYAAPPEKTPEEIEATLKYQKGTITLPNQIATLRLSDNFRYLDPADSEKVLVQIWGNPPRTKTLGMLFPAAISPASKDSWGVIMTYEEDGHIKDEDENKINYDELLGQMKKDLAEANEERQKEGYDKVDLIGWAEKPSYDSVHHKFYWAKELQFGNDSYHTLNYNIRILGRKGVLVLNAVAGMDQLASIKNDMPQILGFTDFNAGNRYTDFDPKIDKVAEYGLAALVAGGVAAKMGLFAKLGMILLAAKKLLIVAAIGIAEFFRRLFKHQKKTA